MSSIDYKKTVFFKLWCENTDYVFIDHSVDVRKKIYLHRRKALSNHPTEPYLTINEHGGWSNWKIDILETPTFDTINAVKEYADNLTNKTIVAKIRPQKNAKSQNSTAKKRNLTQNLEIRPQKNAKIFVCEYCQKSYTRMDSVTRHKHKCKKLAEDQLNQQHHTEVNELKIQLQKEFEEQLETKFESMKSQLMQMLNKECKIHPKTLNKLNNAIQANNSNICTNNNNNNRITNKNNIQIVELGKENISEIFPVELKCKILNKRLSSVDDLILEAHFSDKYAQFRNIAITNIHDNIAYKYTDAEGKFVSVSKDDLLNDVIHYRMDNIREFFDLCKDDKRINKRTELVIDKLITDMEDESVKNKKMRDLKFIIYNQRDKVLKMIK